MKLNDIRAKVAEQRQTGRHRAEPRYHLGPLIVVATVISLTCTAIVTVFLVQGHPEPLAPMQYQPSSAPFVPKPAVFPPVKDQPFPASSTYTVRRHDTMWSIAYRRCGNGMAWKQIQALNSNNPWVIVPGQVLKLPAPACA